MDIPFKDSSLAMMTLSNEQASHTYNALYTEVNLPLQRPAGAMFSMRVTVENQCDWVWLSRHPEGKNVDLTVWINDTIALTNALPQNEVQPGEKVHFRFPLQLPDIPGKYEIIIDMIEQNVTRFRDMKSEAYRQTVIINSSPITAGMSLQERAIRTSPWNYRPSGGIQLGMDEAHYPLFVARSKGCYFWDTEDSIYIDYIMGWGSALLGYAEPRIQSSIRNYLEQGAVVPLSHPLEIEVSEMLIQDIPSAERVIFGKNGSDVCTVAARVARVYTSRKIILYSGYHGWQDWWVEQTGFDNCGVPNRSSPLIFRFKFNDQADFQRLFDLYKNDLAAVMLEPSGPADGPQGLPQDADPAFLRFIADSARSAGALLIFDEIMSGFRYPGGSVQKATGIIPNLTCLGKALGAGMPISALVGQASIMESAMHRTHYGPTFKGEIYSLAAAKTALQIYRDEPVATHVWSHGQRLKQGINNLCGQLGISAECAGPPFRSLLVFTDSDNHRAQLKRTLYFQELLKRGVMTYNGFMLPSYAHNDAVLTTLLDKVGQALEYVCDAEKYSTIDQKIEIPLI